MIKIITGRLAATGRVERLLMAWIAGCVGALAVPPFSVIPAFLVPMMMAVWLIDHSRSIRQAAIYGWWLGFGYFVGGLWWLGAAFLVDPEQFAWALPLGVLGLPALLAIFTAIGFGIARSLWDSSGRRILALAFGLGVSEWLRATVLTGFPWNSFGMTLGGTLETAQIASVIGCHGLDFLAVAIFAAPICLFSGRSRGEKIAAPLMAVLVLAGITGFGVLRLSVPPSAHVPDVKLRLMQANMPEDDRFHRSHAAAIMEQYLQLSSKGSYPDQAGMEGITHLIWPETSFPFLLEREPEALAQIATLLGPDVTLLTGAVRAEDSSDGFERLFYNAIQVVDGDGRITARADKVHLVPFGEYLPFSDLLTQWGVRQFVSAPGGFTAASERSVLNIPGLPPISPLICYEAIFSAEILPKDGTRPGVLLNVTNDGWFGNTPGPFQHFAQARLRAIEQGVPLIRSANTGISAIVDGYGRVTGQLSLGETGVLDGYLPVSLPPTVLSKLDSSLPLTIAVFFLGICLYGRFWKLT